MFATRTHHLDFADTRFTPMEPSLALAGTSHRFEAADALEQLAQADAADRTLLKMVLCAAIATLMLALASSL